MQKTDRRSLREQAVKALNKIATSLNVETVPMRASGETVADLWESLCDKAAEAERQELASVRDSWMGNGGCELDAGLLVPSGGGDDPEADNEGKFPGGEVSVAGHHRVHTASRKGFRIRARLRRWGAVWVSLRRQPRAPPYNTKHCRGVPSK